ncbi:integrase family protein [Vibrio splendidus]
MVVTYVWLRATQGRPYRGQVEGTHRDVFGVRVSPKGKVTWVDRVTYLGKAIRMKLGEYSTMKMSDALREREKKAELFIKLADVIEMVGLPRASNHDMRRTARNIWEVKGVQNVAETMLGHKVHRGVQSHYLDCDYLDEQREAYESWCKSVKPRIEVSE